MARRRRRLLTRSLPFTSVDRAGSGFQGRLRAGSYGLIDLQAQTETLNHWRAIEAARLPGANARRALAALDAWSSYKLKGPAKS
jgi:hypothetical protein